MQEILVFSGTSEGRKLAEVLASCGICVTVCVATEYGQEVMEDSKKITVLVGRLNQQEIEALLQKKPWQVVIDATHPYATEVTENIRKACESQGKEVLRLVRGEGQKAEHVHYVDSTEEAAAYLNQTQGNIFLATGSKEIAGYMERIKDTSRIYARILPGTAELEKCHQLGLKGKQIICMQGPFSEELNLAMMREVQAAWLVTKETAGAGGYPEKIQAARRAGAKAVVIRRPKETGYSMEEVLEKLGIHKEEKKKVSLIGIGMGNAGTLTLEGYQCIKEAELLIGAKRMIASIPEELRQGKEQFISYQTEEIFQCITEHAKCSKIAILFSGDVGFYSGAQKLWERLEQWKIQNNTSCQMELLCGISSVVYFASCIGMSWEDMKLMSLHGRNQNVIGALRQQEKVFTLTGGAAGIRELCRELITYGLEDTQIYIGRQLGSEEQTVEKGSPKEFQNYEKEGLCVLVLVNEAAKKAVVTHGIPDEEFLREKVPMTKEEVRSISISKLQLSKESVIYDIGAGTGSISVECARMAVDGMVYAIEKKPEAGVLIQKNSEKLAGKNLQVIVGEAPEILENLPTPTHAFIGGSSGKLEEILLCLWEKNPGVRIVINAISLETIAEVTQLIKTYNFSQKEIVQVNIAKAKEIGSYQMMMGQNPVYVVTLQR